MEVTMKSGFLFLTLFFYTSFSTNADEIKSAIDQGKSHYQKGEFSQAVAQLNYAATLIQQRKSEQIVDVFPEPLSGWQAEEVASEAAAAMMMGGGISANRHYYKDKASVDIELMMDSPVLQSMAAMFSNPAMITMSGKKLTKINGIHAMYEDMGDEIELIFIVNNNALFTLRGVNTTRKVIESYAKAINITQL